MAEDNATFNGPWPFTEDNIKKHITKTSPGNYRLGSLNVKKKNLTVEYVGRSDVDVADRIADHLDEGYTHFRYLYASSAKDAFEQECYDYHRFQCSANKYHPDKPDGTNYKCPVCGE